MSSFTDTYLATHAVSNLISGLFKRPKIILYIVIIMIAIVISSLFDANQKEKQETKYINDICNATVPNANSKNNPIFSDKSLTYDEISELSTDRIKKLKYILNEDVVGYYRINIESELQRTVFFESDDYKNKHKELRELKEEALTKTHVAKLGEFFRYRSYNLAEENYATEDDLMIFTDNFINIIAKPLLSLDKLIIPKEAAAEIEKTRDRGGKIYKATVYIFYMIDEPSSNDTNEFVTSACRVIIRNVHQDITFFDEIYK